MGTITHLKTSRKGGVWIVDAGAVGSSDCVVSGRVVSMLKKSLLQIPSRLSMGCRTVYFNSVILDNTARVFRVERIDRMLN